MTEEWASGEEWNAFVKHVRENTVKAMKASAFVASFAPDEPDVKFAVELGMSIMLDKPLLVVALPGREVPPRLRRIADRVIYADIDTEEGRLVLAKAFDDFHSEVVE